jgi:Domain of unknown function (DUF6378)
MDSQKELKSAGDFLNEAKSTVTARGWVYADPATNHLRIAHLWSTYLEMAIEPHQVAMCMALVKVARTMESPKHDDSYVDGAAYFALAAEIAKIDWDEHGGY